MSENKIVNQAVILCMDGDPVMREDYKRFLKDTGHSLLTAETAENGLEAARRHRPDIIISDTRLPDSNSLDLYRKIKKEPRLDHSMLILSRRSETDPKSRVKGIDINVEDYFIKPVKKEEFLSKIKSLLRIKSLRDSLADSNKQLGHTRDRLQRYKKELGKKNAILAREKKMLQNSLKQIQLMSEERERAGKELRELYKLQKIYVYGLIDLLSSMIESKRQYHQGHSKKVSEISGFIATHMDLPRHDIQTIKIASLLHEIGKLSIPDDLSMKNPDDYTPKEIALLSRHPVQGADLLNKFAGFKKVAKLIRHFHEHVDGSGVPDNLRGDDIPLGSRIIAAANVFDNLVYRKKNGSADDAFQIMDEMTGSKLDSTIVFHLNKYVEKHPVKDTDRITSVKLYDLKPGMKLAAGIYSLGGAKLLPINTELTEEYINQLANYHKKDPIGETAFIK